MRFAPVLIRRRKAGVECGEARLLDFIELLLGLIVPKLTASAGVVQRIICVRRIRTIGCRLLRITIVPGECRRWQDGSNLHRLFFGTLLCFELLQDGSKGVHRQMAGVAGRLRQAADRFDNLFAP